MANNLETAIRDVFSDIYKPTTSAGQKIVDEIVANAVQNIHQQAAFYANSAEIEDTRALTNMGFDPKALPFEPGDEVDYHGPDSDEDSPLIATGFFVKYLSDDLCLFIREDEEGRKFKVQCSPDDLRLAEYGPPVEA